MLHLSLDFTTLSDVRQEGSTGSSYIILDRETASRTVLHTPQIPQTLELDDDRATVLRAMVAERRCGGRVVKHWVFFLDPFGIW